MKEISYANRTIRIVDVNLANGTCNLPYKSLSSDQVEKDIRYQGQFFYNFAGFINCSTVISDDPSYRKLPCVGGNTSRVYVTVDSSSQSLSDHFPVGCSFLSVVPFSGYLNVQYPSYDAILKLLESGIELGWSVECRNCRLQNKTCFITTFESPLNYYCDNSG